MREIKVEEHTPNDDKCRDMPNTTLLGLYQLIADVMYDAFGAVSANCRC